MPTLLRPRRLCNRAASLESSKHGVKWGSDEKSIQSWRTMNGFLINWSFTMNAWQPLSSLWINLGFHRFEVNLGLKGGSDMLRSTQMSARKCQKPSTWGPKSRPSSGVSTTSSTHGTQRGCVGNFTHPPKCGMPSCESGEAWSHDETRPQHGTVSITTGCGAPTEDSF